MPDAGGPPYALTNFPNGLITSAIFLRDGLITTGDPENPEDPTTPIILDGPILFPMGEINELGEMGIGTTPPPGLYPIGTIHPEGTGWGPDYLEALFRIGGVYTTTNPVIMNIQNIFRPGPEMLPHFSGALNMFAVIPYLEPTITDEVELVVGVAVNPNLSTSATDITTLAGATIGWNVLAEYTGHVSNFVGLSVGGVNYQGTNKAITTVEGISVGGFGTNPNIATGSATQRGIRIASITSGANGGTNTNHALDIQMPSGNATLGTVYNRGLVILGNGGTATGGTVSNYAIYSPGTAQCLFAGPVIQKPLASVTPANNGEMMVQLTSNTQLTVKVRGSDGIVRSTNLTLA
jgi:hypothetical protein